MSRPRAARRPGTPGAVTEPPQLERDLTTLQLATVATQWRPLAEAAARDGRPHADYLAELAHAEVVARRESRIQRRIREARFPVIKTLDTFEFTAQPALDRETVLGLFSCAFVADRANVVLCGGPGTGKSHLAIALGVACCQREQRVRFMSAAELTTTLVESRNEGKLSRTLDRLCRYDCFCIDELGYVPFDRTGADLLFNFITRVYERRSLIVTTNLPFARWSEVFHDATAAAAVIDRIVHHATILRTDGESYRLRSARADARRRGRTDDASGR